VKEFMQGEFIDALMDMLVPVVWGTRPLLVHVKISAGAHVIALPGISASLHVT
jgi:hypothetical protein